MRPIDADELKRRILDSCFCADWVRVLVNRVIDDCPTVDAEPVRYAHWEEYGGKKRNYWCTSCGMVWRKKRPTYCPHCGARMFPKEEQDND